MSQKKSSDHDEHCRLVAERTGQPLALVKQVIGHYYGGVLTLTSARLGSAFMLPNLGYLEFNMRSIDAPIRRLEKKLFFYANIYMTKTPIRNSRGRHIFKSRVGVKRTLHTYLAQYIYFICCILEMFDNDYGRHPTVKRKNRYDNPERAPFGLATLLGNMFRLEQCLGISITLEIFQESDRLKKKALRCMREKGLLDRFKALEPPFSNYRDLREMRLRVTSEDRQPEEQMSA